MGRISILGVSKNSVISSEPDDPDPSRSLQVIDLVQTFMSSRSGSNSLLEKWRHYD